MFKAILTDPNLFKDSIKTIGELIREGIFKINEEGIQMIAMDPAVVTLVVFKLFPTAFSEYNIEEEAKIGVSLDALQEVMNRVTSSDKLTIEIPNKEVIKFKIQNQSTRKFDVPLLEITEEEPEIPNLDKLKSTIELKTDVLYDGIKDADIVSDVINFFANKEEFVMSSEEASKRTELRLEKGSEGLIGLDVTENIKSKFSLGYLKSIIKARKLTDTVIIRLGKDYPVKMDFKAIDKLSLSFILAPRISSK